MKTEKVEYVPKDIVLNPEQQAELDRITAEIIAEVKSESDNSAQQSVQRTLLDWCDECGFLAVNRKTKICGVCKSQSR